MDGFELAEADLDATLQQLHQVVTSVIEATMLTEKKRIEMTARPILREARRKLSALRAEARRTADPGTRARYEEKCRAKDDRIRNYDGEMKSQIFPSQNASRPKAYQEQREEEMMGEGGVDGTGFKSSKQVLSAAINVQADALQSLQRTERLQNVTEEQGKATLQERTEANGEDVPGRRSGSRTCRASSTTRCGTCAGSTGRSRAISVACRSSGWSSWPSWRSSSSAYGQSARRAPHPRDAPDAMWPSSHPRLEDYRSYVFRVSFVGGRVRDRTRPPPGRTVTSTYGGSSYVR
ncbi:QA-SNARE protein [Strigomonas culicis]|uniref:QA-SNARE protein n=1 Tax=Strigomonas culicis TaxID=28005 RepID=S9VR75_9TRYP|nr:QA-SNARE protein [Strigomonas culicis]|eukprot:EPY25665.1 QA-SNARE protein [Strigomonas culicis]